VSPTRRIEPSSRARGELLEGANGWNEAMDAEAGAANANIVPALTLCGRLPGRITEPAPRGAGRTARPPPNPV